MQIVMMSHDAYWPKSVETLRILLRILWHYLDFAFIFDRKILEGLFNPELGLISVLSFTCSPKTCQ